MPLVRAKCERLFMIGWLLLYLAIHRSFKEGIWFRFVYIMAAGVAVGGLTSVKYEVFGKVQG